VNTVIHIQVPQNNENVIIIAATIIFPKPPFHGIRFQRQKQQISKIW